MNALHRDLEKLAREYEARARAQAASDPYRPRFHLAPPTGWLNDPNGLCRCGEWYHVFYQYAPFDPNGGVKLWGHARSRDLLSWETLPPALYPDQPWDIHGVYSGSALVEDGVMYLYYTGNVKHAGDFDYIRAGRGHNTALAVCRDGVTIDFKELLLENQAYPPGLTCHVRDPKVWAQDGKYYMVQGARTMEDRGELLVFASEDKRHWTHLNTLTTQEPFGYMWECPDLFTLGGQSFLLSSPQGVPQERWRYQNVYACGYFPLHGDFRAAYTLGAFEELDMGFDFYAPQTFTDGSRRLIIGWMGMPDAPYGNAPTVRQGWQGLLTVPCELSYEHGRLCRTPVSELEALRGDPVAAQDAEVFDLVCRTAAAAGRLVFRSSAVLEWEEGALRLSYLCGGEGRDERCVKLARVQELRVLADTSSLEIFVNGGEVVLTARYYPEAGARGIEAQGTEALTLWEMRRMTVQ